MKKSIKILCVGNSFSDDMSAYAYEVLKSLGYENIILGNLYIGGCTLARHLLNARTNKPEYIFRVNTTGEWVNHENETILHGLEFADWDIITMQQASHYSGIIDAYRGNLWMLTDYVKEHCSNKNVKLYWHMTWAYDKDCQYPFFNIYAKDQRRMYESILNAVEEEICPNPNFSGVIKNGIAMQLLRDEEGMEHVTRDGFHALIPDGRYMLACNFISTVLNENVDNISWRPEGMTDKGEKKVKDKVKKSQAVTELTKGCYVPLW